MIIFDLQEHCSCDLCHYTWTPFQRSGEIGKELKVPKTCPRCKKKNWNRSELKHKTNKLWDFMKSYN